MSEWTDERLQRLSIYRGGDEQLRSDIRAALDTISAQFRRAENAEAEVERLRAAGQRCMEISTGLAAAGIVGHMNILDVMGVALERVQ